MFLIGCIDIVLGLFVFVGVCVIVVGDLLCLLLIAFAIDWLLDVASGCIVCGFDFIDCNSVA